MSHCGNDFPVIRSVLLQIINPSVTSRPPLFKVHLTVFKRRDELSGISRCYAFDFKRIFVEKKMPFG